MIMGMVAWKTMIFLTTSTLVFKSELVQIQSYGVIKSGEVKTVVFSFTTGGWDCLKTTRYSTTQWQEVWMGSRHFQISKVSRLRVSNLEIVNIVFFSLD